jgi:hypothetical protein
MNIRKGRNEAFVCGGRAGKEAKTQREHEGCQEKKIRSNPVLVKLQ